MRRTGAPSSRLRSSRQGHGARRTLAALVAILAGAFSLAGTGCLTPDQLQGLQTDVAAIREQMAALEKQNQAASAKLAELQTTVAGREQTDRERAADSKRQMDGLREEIRTVGNRLDEMQHRIDAAGASAPTRTLPPPVRPDTADPDSASGDAAAAPRAGNPGRPEDLFNASYADYSKGNYAPAILGFEEFLRSFADSDKADDALYWIGLCHYDQGEYAEAVATFDRLIREHPDGDKLPGAYLKKGLALLQMNRTAQGVVQLQYVAEKFPRSEEARIAKDRLGELGVKP